MCVTPTNTPVCEPASARGSIPACSTACQDVSSNTRCCGSIETASRSLMLKKSASNPPTSSRKAPHLEGDLPGTPDSGS
ncbi:Uncharacterised protein [Mycobacteroides abscessus subsp. abscessus]|nr:Uncharacterised protein [Mycobacteroides abscessus subsp. abscessus]